MVTCQHVHLRLHKCMTSNLPPALFVAESSALDFVNSRATPTGQVVDWLRSGEDFLSWLGQAKLAPPDVISSFRSEGNVADLELVAGKARSLRDWFRGFVISHMGRPLTPKAADDLKPINQILAGDQKFHQIARREAREGENAPLLSWQLERRWRNPEALLTPIAEAIGEFVCSSDFSYVKACEGMHCTILFFDNRKKGARRWCDMAVCGNRAKQAAHRARLKKD